MHVKNRWLALLMLVPVAASILTGCTAHGGVPRKESRVREKPAVPFGGVLLQGAGATFPSLLYAKWFSVYQSGHPQSAITYDAVGSGEGIRRFIAQNVSEDEKVDFGASDAAMRDDEMARVPGGAILLPVTAGSVALAYNLPDIPVDLKLSRQAYAGIFMGQIKSWNDPLIAQANPGVSLPKLTITTVVRQDGSGTTFAFTKHLDAISDGWRSQFGPATLINWPGNSMRASGNEGVAGRIKESVGSVGYVSYEFARRIGLKVALLENRAGKYVAPSGTSSSAALAGAELPENMRLYVPDPSGDESYPIVTLTWILLYKNYAEPQKFQALRELFRWCLTDGQKYAPELGYTPLPANIASRSLAALDVMQLASNH
jgi:phosphate transport system substrate-binding protein